MKVIVNPKEEEIQEFFVDLIETSFFIPKETILPYKQEIADIFLVVLIRCTIERQSNVSPSEVFIDFSENKLLRELVIHTKNNKIKYVISFYNFLRVCIPCVDDIINIITVTKSLPTSVKKPILRFLYLLDNDIIQTYGKSIYAYSLRTLLIKSLHFANTQDYSYEKLKMQCNKVIAHITEQLREELESAVLNKTINKYIVRRILNYALLPYSFRDISMDDIDCYRLIVYLMMAYVILSKIGKSKELTIIMDVLDNFILKKRPEVIEDIFKLIKCFILTDFDSKSIDISNKLVSIAEQFYKDNRQNFNSKHLYNLHLLLAISSTPFSLFYSLLDKSETTVAYELLFQLYMKLPENAKNTLVKSLVDNCHFKYDCHSAIHYMVFGHTRGIILESIQKNYAKLPKELIRKATGKLIEGSVVELRLRSLIIHYKIFHDKKFVLKAIKDKSKRVRTLAQKILNGELDKQDLYELLWAEI